MHQIASSTAKKSRYGPIKKMKDFIQAGIHPPQAKYSTFNGLSTV
ncbi:hypothetical protein ACPR111641_16315 [Acinetobacter pragensis]